MFCLTSLSTLSIWQSGHGHRSSTQQIRFFSSSDTKAIVSMLTWNIIKLFRAFHTSNQFKCLGFFHGLFPCLSASSFRSGYLDYERLLTNPVLPGLFYNHLCCSLIHSLSQWYFSSKPSKHHYTQTERARELTFWENGHAHHLSHIMYQVSCVMCQVSGVCLSVYLSVINGAYPASLKRSNAVIVWMTYWLQSFCQYATVLTECSCLDSMQLSW